MKTERGEDFHNEMLQRSNGSTELHRTVANVQQAGSVDTSRTGPMSVVEIPVTEVATRWVQSSMRGVSLEAEPHRSQCKAGGCLDGQWTGSDGLDIGQFED